MRFPLHLYGSSKLPKLIPLGDDQSVVAEVWEVPHLHEPFLQWFPWCKRSLWQAGVCLFCLKMSENVYLNWLTAWLKISSEKYPFNISTFKHKANSTGTMPSRRSCIRSAGNHQQHESVPDLRLERRQLRFNPYCTSRTCWSWFPTVLGLEWACLHFLVLYFFWLCHTETTMKLSKNPPREWAAQLSAATNNAVPFTLAPNCSTYTPCFSRETRSWMRGRRVSP